MNDDQKEAVLTVIEFYTERAAIYEFEANKPRDIAEAMAMDEVAREFGLSGVKLVQFAQKAIRGKDGQRNETRSEDNQVLD